MSPSTISLSPFSSGRTVIKLTPADPGYPQRLLTAPGRPDVLWVDGELPDPRCPMVAIVGTRRLTAYGCRVARELAGAVAGAGAVVVSGLAQGIDSTAHVAALEAGAQTVAVLGQGIAHFSQHGPLRRRDLARRIRAHGALVSEYAPDVRPTEWTFPRRNATIAGLSDALVVVEAPEGSGALITADRMLDLGRPVYVVPGPLGAPTWVGANRYIAEGRARLLAAPEQLLGALGLSVPLGAAGAPRPNPLGERLLALLAAQAADADAIAAGLGISGPAAAVLIAQQLITGRIVARGDGRFARA